MHTTTDTQPQTDKHTHTDTQPQTDKHTHIDTQPQTDTHTYRHTTTDTQTLTHTDVQVQILNVGFNFWFSFHIFFVTGENAQPTLAISQRGIV